MEYNLSQIGTKFKFIREKNNLSQEELASKLSVNVSTISAIERDTRAPSVATVIKFCNYFNISSDYLLSLNTELSNDNTLYNLNLNLDDYIYADGLSSDEKKTLRKLVEHLQTQKY